MRGAVTVGILVSIYGAHLVYQVPNGLFRPTAEAAPPTFNYGMAIV